MWLYPYGTYATMAGMLGVLGLMALSPTHSIELWASVLVAAICLAGYGARVRFAAS
jgi:L-asparagine transporter-like permease